MTEQTWLFGTNFDRIINYLLENTYNPFDYTYNLEHEKSKISPRKFKLILIQLIYKLEISSYEQNLLNIIKENIDNPRDFNFYNYMITNNFVRILINSTNLISVQLLENLTYHLNTKSNIKEYCNIIRCILGNPFRSVQLSLTPTVKGIVKQIYDTQIYNDNLLILHDALIDANCNDQEILQSLLGFQRCYICLGLGKKNKTVQNFNRVNEGYKTKVILTQCTTCKGIGWIKSDLPIPYCKGYWIIDSILGYN